MRRTKQPRYTLTALFGPDPASSRILTERGDALKTLRGMAAGLIIDATSVVIVDEVRGTRIFEHPTLDLTEPERMGRNAFAAGIRCAPALDPTFCATLAGSPVGNPNTIRRMDAWIRGWTLANLAAPIVNELDG
jgi:hypothetical protein